MSGGNTSTPPLLAPPPSDLTNQQAVRTWMNNIYTFLFSSSFIALSPTGLQAQVNTINATLTTIGGEITALNTGAAGTWVLLSTQTGTGVSSLNFPSVFSSTYNQYKVILKNIFSVTTGHFLAIQYTTNGGSSYDSTLAHYPGVGYAISLGAQTPQDNQNILANNVLGTSATTSLSGELLITNPNDTTSFCHCSGQLCTTTLIQLTTVDYNQTGTAVTGFQLIPASGTITGAASVYGILQ